MTLSESLELCRKIIGSLFWIAQVLLWRKYVPGLVFQLSRGYRWLANVFTNTDALQTLRNCLFWAIAPNHHFSGAVFQLSLKVRTAGI